LAKGTTTRRIGYDPGPHQHADPMAGPADHDIHAVALPGREGVFSLSLRGGAIAAVERASPVTGAKWLALPGLINQHAHADRAHTVSAFRPRSFADALAAAAKAREAFTAADVESRASRFFERSLGHGVTRVRTHTDVDPVVEFQSLDGVGAAKAKMAGRMDVDIIAFSTSRNDLAEPQAAARLKEAVGRKPQFLGASLNSSADPARALAALLDIAEQSGLPLDLHLDEHLEPQRMLTPTVADAVIARGLQGRVTISHLCALSTLDAHSVQKLIERIALAEIAVVALPETNLFLQDRGAHAPLRRGITLIRELLAAGVTVRFGTDNVRDWFFPFGDGDMLDTAMFAAVAAHLDDETALIAGICDGRTAVSAGDPADLVLVPADSLDDALARRPPGRAVFKAGRQVSGPPPG
jgi:cytosine deaminase